MTDQKRQYRMKRRAELQQDTRRRITESAVELHGTVGPVHTSISAVAELAGVRRSTVYRHFPDEAALFFACSAHWIAANPLPDIARWAAIDDPQQRLRSALGELYAYYGQTEQMMSNVLRDEATMSIVRRMLGGYRGYIDAACATLMSGRELQGRRRSLVRAAIGHALAFATWRSLVRDEGLADSRASDLMCCLVACAAR